MIKNQKLNLFEIIDDLLSKIGIFSNTIFFDKTNFDKLDFIKICLRTFQIPSRNL